MTARTVHTLDADVVLSWLTGLRDHYRARGRGNKAAGIDSAISKIRRELAKQQATNALQLASRSASPE